MGHDFETPESKRECIRRGLSKISQDQKRKRKKEATQSTSDKPLLYQSTWHQQKAQKQKAERIHT